MTAILKKKMKHELIRMKKEEINLQQNSMKFEVKVPLKQLELSIKIINKSQELEIEQHQLTNPKLKKFTRDQK